MTSFHNRASDKRASLRATAIKRLTTTSWKAKATATNAKVIRVLCAAGHEPTIIRLPWHFGKPGGYAKCLYIGCKVCGVFNSNPRNPWQVAFIRLPLRRSSQQRNERR